VLFLLYSLRSLRKRIRTDAITVLAVCLLVIGSALGMSFYLSLKKMLVDTTPAENIVVLSQGAATEGGSKLSLETAQRIAVSDGVKKDGETPLVVREVVTRVYLSEDDGGANAPVTIRGIDEQSLKVHRITMMTGAPPAPGSLEIILGRRVAKRYPELAINSDVALPGGPSRIVGIMTDGGGPLDDEVWTPRSALELHLRTKVSSSVTIVADQVSRVPEIVQRITDSKDLEAQAMPLRKLREDDAGLQTTARVVLILLILLTVVVTFAIATTMAAAAAMRMSEFAALAAIGIRRGVLARIVLVESILLATMGAVVGVLVSALISSQIGDVSVSENLVAVSSSTSSLLVSLGLGVLVGVIGGVMPAMRVRRLDIIQSLR
jgi:putative ABC transport system permease protein